MARDTQSILTEDQENQLRFWTYLLKDITPNHAKSWYQQLLNDKGFEEAELFRNRVNYINKKRVL